MNKNDILLEFHQDDTDLGKDVDVMTEIKLFVPPGSNYNEGDEESTSVEALHKKILSLSAVNEMSSGSGICSFEEVPIVAPRGKFDFELYGKFLTMRSKTNDYKIMYSNISKIFYLPKPDGIYTAVMIHLESPIRQGNSHYNSLVCQLHRDTELEVTLNLPDDVLAKHDKLEKVMRMDIAKLLSTIVSQLAGCKLHRPSKNFASEKGDKGVYASIKSNSGHLYMLEKFFVFINKPPTIVKFEEVRTVQFVRAGKIGGGASSSSFDLEIELKSGVSHEFSNIPRGEYNNLFNFMTDKNINISNVDPTAAAMDLDDDSDDGGIESDGPRRGPEGSESEDDDFDPEGSGRDDQSEEEEYDEDRASEDSEEEDEEGENGGEKKEKKEKKEREPKEHDPESMASRKARKEKKERKEKAASSPKKASKKKKDPNAPKGAMTGFMFFSGEMRPKLLEEGKSITEVAVACGAAWRELDDEGKSKFNAMADADKIRAATEMEAYRAKRKEEGLGDFDGGGKKSKKKKKDSNAPKNALSAFMFFCSASRPAMKEANPDWGIPEMGKALGAKWKELSDEEKQPFNDQAAADKTRAETEKAAYKLKRAEAGEESSEEERAPKKQKTSSPKKAREPKAPKAPKGATAMPDDFEVSDVSSDE